MTETTILDESAVSEIETRLKKWIEHEIPHTQYPASWKEVDALCRTVKQLREQCDGLRGRTAELHNRIGERNERIVDLQSQLEQLRAENDALKDKYRSADVHVAALLNARCGSGPTHLGIEHSLSIIDQQFDENRSRATQLCKDKAAEHRRIADLRTKNLNDTGAAIEQARADTANDICSELEKL